MNKKKQDPERHPGTRFARKNGEGREGNFKK